ncbi:hypothetical protein K1Y77_15600 [Halomonas qaidamensis]|uniref:DUF3990 domain-containing protein n=1 Tax=Halomonas qaidamensis TaxID=2866211 RepID=A0ABY6JQR1_9GAMM|nr:hypothetical protein [Halomonas qaidamensis]UYV18859.1 hypothetical protein K1Y77_15600 [Halomonas qaidamensis]
MQSGYKLSPLVGYHGCDKAVAEKVLSGQAHLNHSENEYDWLGDGIYFWVDSYERALEWANKGNNKTPYVVGAFIDPGFCLNLTDYGVTSELKTAYQFLKETYAQIGEDLPTNAVMQHGKPMTRKLDCAVIKAAHQLRQDAGEPSFDTVYGVFEEGDVLYPGSALKEHTHVQMAVRNQQSIIGYFRPEQLISSTP